MDPSSLTKTSFCGKQIDNVTSNETKEYILKDMKLKCEIDYNSRYAKIFNNQYSKNLNNITYVREQRCLLDFVYRRVQTHQHTKCTTIIPQSIDTTRNCV